MQKRFVVLVSLALLVGVIASCSRDPNVRKQKYYNVAMRYFNKGKYREASLELRNAVKIDPRFSDAHYQLAQCYLKLGFTGQAYAELLKAIDAEPHHWKAQIDLGYLLFAAHQFDQAQQKANLVLADEPSNADAHALMANITAAQGHIDQALVEMKKSVELAPGESKFLNLALLEEGARQPAAAEEDYKKAISSSPKSARPLSALGGFYMRQHRFADAEQEFRGAIELEPKNPSPRADLVRMFVVEGQQDKAEQAAREAKLGLKNDSVGYRMLGDLYLSLGQKEKAVAEYASLYHDHPSDLSVMKVYVQLLIQKNDLPAATKVNDEVLKQSPGDVGSLITRGQILIQQRRANDAMAPLQSALKADPGNATAHYFLGLAFNQLAKTDRAMTEWQEAVRLNPDLVDAHLEIASAAQRQGDMGQLGKSAEALIRLLPSSPVGYAYRGLVEASRRDLPGTEADLKKAIEVAPKHPLGWTRMGQLLTAEKRFKEAEKAYETALENDANYAEALGGLSRVYLLEKDPAKAIRRVNEQIAKVPNNSDYQVLLGTLLLDQKQYGSAEAAFQKAVDLNNDNMNAFLALAQTQVLQGAQDRAIASCQRSMQTNPTYLPSYVLLAILEDRQGKWQIAQATYQKALGMQPDYALAENNLAFLMLEHGGNLDVALSLAQGARRTMPDSAGVADTLAWAFYKKGEYQAAIDLLREALKIQPNDPDFNYHIGKAYQMNKDRADAIQHLERVLKINPNFSNAGEVREALASLSKG